VASGNNKNNTKKRTSAANSKSAASDKKAQNTQRSQLSAIILFGSALLLLCVVLIKGGGLWELLREVIFGLFGFCSFILPLLLVYVAVITAMNKDYSKVSIKVIQSVVLVFLVSAAVCIFSNNGDVNLWEDIKNAYNNYREAGITLGPGAAGTLIGSLILMLTGSSKAAAGAIILILIFVFVMLITGITLIRLFKGIWSPVEKAKTYTEQKLEENANRDREVQPAKNTKKIDEIDPSTDLVPSKSARDIYTLDEADFEKGNRRGGKKTDDAAADETPEKNTNVLLDDIIKKASGNTADAKKSAEETKKAESEIAKEIIEDDENTAPYVYPPIDCLASPKGANHLASEAELRSNAEKLVETLRSFGVETKIVGLSRGPSVTRYEIQPAAGVKISRITNLADDIALNLAASGVRIGSVPDKKAIGIEVPNRTRNMVTLREIIDTDEFRNAKSKINVALGKDITGLNVYADLQKMPHLLVAGTTGSGKSVCLNTMIISILYNASPDEVKLILIDPKQVEFLKYNGIPHLLVPVVSNPNKASGALAWAVTEMLKRYTQFAEKGVRDIFGYNSVCEQLGEKKMYQIVIFIDEFSDLMMAAPNEVEDSVCRLAQMARAAGMHLVVATQRPSVDVITGVIKSNIPSRIALSVKSSVESRIMLDEGGAEKLLGNGDLLYNPISVGKPVRVQGAFISDKEIENVVNFIKKQGESNYDDSVIEEIERNAEAKNKKKSADVDNDDGESDEMLPKAIEVVVEAQQASTTLLQRKLKLGYARAARIIDELEQRNIIGPYEGSKPRKVLISKQQWLEMNAMAAGSGTMSGADDDDTDGDVDGYSDEVLFESESDGHSVF
jgi:S-DNA-T family DNA segregation ATPase FtsK/SpoIIIE